jgi:hypothetical protein
MESSTVLAFRIFVMLSCLIIVPLAAIFGSAFPDVVKTVLVDRIVALSTGKPVENAPSADPNGFRTVGPNIGAPGATEPGQTWDSAPRWNGPNVQSPQMAASGVPSAVVPVGGPGDAAAVNQSASYSAPVHHEPVTPAGGVYGGAPAPLPTNPATVAPMPGSADRMACPLEPTDPFKDMERRLRQYGATYYLLETWGQTGELYRFHCRMAVASNASYTRHFEATDHDALKAMADVLSQVEAWRNSGSVEISHQQPAAQHSQSPQPVVEVSQQPNAGWPATAR